MDGSHLEHDGHLPKLAHRLDPVPIVDAVLHTGSQLPPVGDVPLSALGGQHIAVGNGHLVGWRQHRLVEEHVHDLDAQPVAAAHVLGLRVRVAIEEDLCANLPDGFLEVAALCEDLIERVDVGVYGCGEGRVGGAVLGRVLEELLATGRVEVGGPPRVGGRGGHGGGRRAIVRRERLQSG